MERLTYYDYLANCYKIRPNAPQGQIIQRLGDYESKFESLLDKTLSGLLEQITGEMLTDSAIKSDEWVRGYNEGLKIAEDYVKGAIRG